jgi:hypothetical protein
VADGAARLTSTVTVRFDRTYTLASNRLPLASYFEFAVPVPGKGTPKRVLVQTAEAAANNPRLVTLTVDTLLPEGTILKVARRAFTRDEEGDIEAPVTSDLSPVQAYLAASALQFSRPEMLNPPVTAEVRDSDRDPQAMRAELQHHLEVRGASASTKEAALGRYDRIPVATVPSPKLRAVLSALTGTWAQPAIDYLLGTENCTGKPAGLIAFQAPPGGAELIARSTTRRDGSRVISLNPKVEGERIELLMPLLAHEAIHCDDKDGRVEEVAATAFDTFFYLQLLTPFPELARLGTVLGRELNIDGLAMINSGRRWPESAGILKSAGVARAIPGTTAQFASFGDVVVAAYPQIDRADSPSEPLADKYVANLAAAAGMDPGAAFDLRYLDELLGRALEPAQLAGAISALELTPA